MKPQFKRKLRNSHVDIEWTAVLTIVSVCLFVTGMSLILGYTWFYSFTPSITFISASTVTIVTLLTQATLGLYFWFFIISPFQLVSYNRKQSEEVFNPILSFLFFLICYIIFLGLFICSFSLIAYHQVILGFLQEDWRDIKIKELSKGFENQEQYPSGYGTTVLFSLIFSIPVFLFLLTLIVIDLWKAFNLLSLPSIAIKYFIIFVLLTSVIVFIRQFVKMKNYKKFLVTFSIIYMCCSVLFSILFPFLLAQAEGKLNFVQLNPINEKILRITKLGGGIKIETNKCGSPSSPQLLFKESNHAWIICDENHTKGKVFMVRLSDIKIIRATKDSHEKKP